MERSVAYIGPSPAADGGPIVDDFYMFEAQYFNPHKRQHTEQHPLPSPPPSKRQKKLQHCSLGYIDTPAFWDSLSKIWLTKHALRELNRRNAKPLLYSPSPRAHRPVTRNLLAEVKKRHKPIQSVSDFLHNCTPKTLKNIKLFARYGGPDLSDLRGHPESTHSFEYTMSLRHSSRHSRVQKRASSSRTKTTTTKTTVTKITRNSRPQDVNYHQKLIDGGVYPYGYKFPDGSKPPLPPNLEEVIRRLAQPRSSPSPSRFLEKYEEFIERDAEAFNEDAVKDSVIPAMLRAMGTSNRTQRNVWFTNIDPIVAGISQAKPEYYYGAQPEQIHPDIRNNEQLNKHIIPSSHTHLPAVPNFSLEAKGPDGSSAEAIRQACHDGALGERAMHSLRAYGQDQPVYDNNIHTISSTYCDGTLKMYGHSIAQPEGPGTRPEYYMHHLKGWNMTGDQDTFLKGATTFKNAVDLTREYRDAAIAHANEMRRIIDHEGNIEEVEESE
ncbi:hypothetical protein GP486_001474 [Trichoglossum hirsutum]|uniref:DUF7924 domain-containing protein n=1 Tax=Trichoglossum hirsutum TaxID=265104 RepID=A0A9P8RSN4_9PEZI|nr:hypothetical protein GP486_001474 [Trichoglossum hirsutum]